MLYLSKTIIFFLFSSLYGLSEAIPMWNNEGSSHQHYNDYNNGRHRSPSPHYAHDHSDMFGQQFQNMSLANHDQSHAHDYWGQHFGLDHNGMPIDEPNHLPHDTMYGSSSIPYFPPHNSASFDGYPHQLPGSSSSDPYEIHDDSTQGSQYVDLPSSQNNEREYHIDHRENRESETRMTSLPHDEPSTMYTQLADLDCGLQRYEMDELCGYRLHNNVMMPFTRLIQRRTGFYYSTITLEARERMTPRILLRLMSNDENKIQPGVDAILPVTVDHPATWVRYMSQHEVLRVVDHVRAHLEKADRRTAFDFLYRKNLQRSTAQKLLHGTSEECEKIIQDLNFTSIDVAQDSEGRVMYMNPDAWAKGLSGRTEMSKLKRIFKEATDHKEGWWRSHQLRGDFKEGFGLQIKILQNNADGLRRLAASFKD
jgi:hypothetical protein